MANEDLTKEKFKDIFDDNFKMTNYAIHMAQQQIHGGNEDLNITDLLSEIYKRPPQLKQETACEEESSNDE